MAIIHNIVLAPASVQEAIDLMGLSFDLAEKYRMIRMMILDGSMGQMMEPAQMPEMKPIERSVIGIGPPTARWEPRTPHT